MKELSPVRDKSHAFALFLTRVIKRMQENRRETVLSKECLIAGARIGLEIEEASVRNNQKNVIMHLSSATKYARESQYWLRLLRDMTYIDKEDADKLIADSYELSHLLTLIIKDATEAD